MHECMHTKLTRARTQVAETATAVAPEHPLRRAVAGKQTELNAPAATATAAEQGDAAIVCVRPAKPRRSPDMLLS